jgi:hypothetical protein
MVSKMETEEENGEYGENKCSMWYFKCKKDCPYKNDKTYCYLHTNKEIKI